MMLPLLLSLLRPCRRRLGWLGLWPGSEVLLHLRAAWHRSLRLPAARVSDQAHLRGDHASRQVHRCLCAEEPLLKRERGGTARRTPANSTPLYQPPNPFTPPTFQPSLACIHGYREHHPPCFLTVLDRMSRWVQTIKSMIHPLAEYIFFFVW